MQDGSYSRRGCHVHVLGEDLASWAAPVCDHARPFPLRLVSDCKEIARASSTMAAAAVLLSYLLLGCLLLMTTARCPEGRFGRGCRHVCHCAPFAACNDVTGECRGSRCARGYFGPSCQARDGALGATIASGASPLALIDDPRARHCRHTISGALEPFRLKLNDSVPITHVQLTLRAHRTLEGAAPDPDTVDMAVDGVPCRSSRVTASTGRNPYIIVNASCGGALSDEIILRMASPGDVVQLCALRVTLCSEGFQGAQCQDSCHQGEGCASGLEEGSAACGPDDSDPCSGEGNEEGEMGAAPKQDGPALDGRKTHPGGVHWPSAGVGAGISVAVLVVVGLGVVAAVWGLRRRRRRLRPRPAPPGRPAQLDDGYEVPRGVPQADQTCYATLNPNTRELSANVYQEVGGNPR